MKRSLPLIIILAGLALALAPLLRAQTPQPLAGRAPRPTAAVAAKGCVTAACHPEVKDFTILHGPVNVDACEACHQVQDEGKHTFSLLRQKQDLCTFCHVIDLSDAKFTHKPVTEGACLDCHNPHGGTRVPFLRANSTRQVCNTCHQDIVGKKSHVHGPVAAGECDTCHSLHSSDYENLLVAQGRDLCLRCHQEMGQQFQNVQFKHKAVEGDCMTCHDAHASEQPGMILQEPLALCTTECHQQVREAVFAAPHKHAAVTEGSACVNCHTPHGSSLATLMKDKPVKICLKCHEKKLVAGDGHVIAAVNDINDSGKVKHGPVKDGTCGGCHNVHGSTEAKLLRKPYPEAFYSAFTTEKYELCFTCHDPQLVQLPTAGGLTKFRNGQNNLHYLHVNKTKRGRTCRACHSTHASNFPELVRDAVPYGKGNWELPIRFEPTANGGSCSPGCHQKMVYDREKPVAPLSKPAQTATASSTAAAAAPPAAGNPPATQPAQPATPDPAPAAPAAAAPSAPAPAAAVASDIVTSKPEPPAPNSGAKP